MTGEAPGRYLLKMIAGRGIFIHTFRSSKFANFYLDHTMLQRFNAEPQIAAVVA